MAGTIPVSGDFTMDGLADALTRHEQLAFELVTHLWMDPTRPRNLMTTVDQPLELGPLSICASGSDSDGEKILSATVYISGVAARIDLYRLNN